MVKHSTSEPEETEEHSETATTENRREWVRVDDCLLLDYWQEGAPQAPLEGETPETLDESITNFISKPTQDFLSRLQHEEKQESLVPWLMKIDWVLELVLQSMVRLAPHRIVIPKLKRVNISGGGIGFLAATQFSSGVHLALRLIIPPFTPISAKAEVIRSEANPEEAGLYSIATRFTDMSEPDHEQLIKHILSVQASTQRTRHNTSDEAKKEGAGPSTIGES